MTAEQRLYYDHVRRGADYVCDQRLCRAVIERHARRRGNTFFSTETDQ